MFLQRNRWIIVVIDVEIDKLTRKESSHLENLDLASQPPIPALKRQSHYMVLENKKIPAKMLKKNIKIEKWFLSFQTTNCNRLYLVFYVGYVIFLKNICCF